MNTRLAAAALCLAIALASIWLGSWLMSFTEGWVRSAVGMTMALALFTSAMVLLWKMMEARS